MMLTDDVLVTIFAKVDTELQLRKLLDIFRARVPAEHLESAIWAWAVDNESRGWSARANERLHLDKLEEQIKSGQVIDPDRQPSRKFGESWEAWLMRHTKAYFSPPPTPPLDPQRDPPPIFRSLSKFDEVCSVELDAVGSYRCILAC